MAQFNLQEAFTEFQTATKVANRPFLLFDIDNANENAHTRFLERLLSITDRNGNRPFLTSFVEQFGLPHIGSAIKDVCVTTQKQAIGPKKVGYIDLYIQYKDEAGETIKVVVENKVKKAGDCPNQLARYIATAAGIDRDKFEKNIDCDNADWYGALDHIYVIYLSYSASEEPSKDSLPSALRDKLKDNYSHLNYQDDLLPWLENELPNVPYGINGTLASGMHQYVEYLKWYCGGTNDAWQPMNGWKLVDPNKTDIDNYKNIGALLASFKDETSDQDASRFCKLIESEREKIFANDCENDEWAIHFTPSFVCLYKKSWANADMRKYSIPSVYFIANYKDFEQSATLTWNINVDHLSPDVQKRDQSDRFPDLLYNALVGEGVKFRLANKQKTASATSLLISIDNQEAVGKMDGDARKAYFESLLAATQTQKIAKLVDRAVASVFA